MSAKPLFERLVVSRRTSKNHEPSLSLLRHTSIVNKRKHRFPNVIRGNVVIDDLRPCGKAVAYYVVEDAYREEVIMDFSNYESIRHRMDEIKKRLVAQRRMRKAEGKERQWNQESES